MRWILGKGCVGEADIETWGCGCRNYREIAASLTLACLLFAVLTPPALPSLTPQGFSSNLPAMELKS